jgi:hypothetical protein
MRCLKLLFGAAAAAAILSSSACVIHTEESGPMLHKSESFDLDKNADVVRAYLKMGAGTLRVSSGATDKLARADFDYNVRSWQPEVDYHDGTLRISQPNSSGTHLGNTKYEWDVRLNRDVPLELNINFGAGEARLDLGALSLRRVNIEMGVGEINLDLRGTPKHDYEVRIRGGVGEATVHLPSDVGIYAEAHGGIGEISARGLKNDGGAIYHNDLYKKAPVTVRLDVQGGVGSIKLLAD